MTLFEVYNAMFSRTGWKKVTQSEKSNNFFMICRFLSTEYPNEINATQIAFLGKHNYARLLDCWHEILLKKHTSPIRVYKSSVVQKDKDHLKDINNDTISLYLTINKISKKSFDYLLSIRPAELRAELLGLSKLNEAD